MLVKAHISGSTPIFFVCRNIARAGRRASQHPDAEPGLGVCEVLSWLRLVVERQTLPVHRHQRRTGGVAGYWKLLVLKPDRYE